MLRRGEIVATAVLTGDTSSDDDDGGSRGRIHEMKEGRMVEREIEEDEEHEMGESRDKNSGSEI